VVGERTSWLIKCRGLETSGLKFVLLERVLKYYDREGYRELNGQQGGTVEVLKDTMASLQEMIQWIMKRNINLEYHYTEMERRMRAFLTFFAKLEVGVREANDKTNSKPGWLSAYNFLTLLNLPEQIRTFGLPRWHWEGTVAGEGFL
jgi:hypothetical protein